MPEVSVVVPVHSADAYLAEMFERLFLDGLRNNAPDPRMELVIVDDASPLAARTAAAAEAASAWVPVKLLRNARSLGWLGSCNAGLRAASGAELLLCNSDTRLPPGVLERLRRSARSDARIGLVGPMSNGAFGSEVQSAEGFADLSSFSAEELARIDRFGERFAGREAGLTDVRWLVGFCALLKREVLETVGLFDERFGFGYEEEVDYGLRARRAGWRLCVDERAFVFHGGLRRPLQLFGSRSGSQSSGRRPLRTLLRIAGNLALLWMKHGRAEIAKPQRL